jgi:hypothetical protein
VFLGALAGLSTTSPAAIRLISASGSLLIDICAHVAQAPAPSESFHGKPTDFAV